MSHFIMQIIQEKKSFFNFKNPLMHNTNAKKKTVNQKSQQKYFAQNKFIFKYMNTQSLWLSYSKWTKLKMFAKRFSKPKLCITTKSTCSYVVAKTFQYWEINKLKLALKDSLFCLSDIALCSFRFLKKKNPFLLFTFSLMSDKRIQLS